MKGLYTVGATHNSSNRITPKDGVIQITELSVPKIKLSEGHIAKIIKAFKLSAKYIRDGEVSKTVKNSVGQYCQNSTVTGRVIVKVKGRAKTVAVDLFGYWPSWKLSEDGKVRLYSKEHSATVLKLMASGSFSNPTAQLLEHVAYNALSVIKSRQNTPREGLIKSQVLEYLEASGIQVVKAWYRGKEYNREYITSKVKTMRVIFDAMRSVKQFEDIEKRRDSTVFTIKGQ